MRQFVRFEAPTAAAVLCAAALCAAVPCASTGCAARSADPATAAPTLPSAETDGAVAPIAPVSGDAPPATHTAAALKLSALSRVERVPGRRPLIELRVDAVDAAGAPARLGGLMRVTVQAPGAQPETQAFDIPLRTQPEADRHFDAILRQYVLRIEPTWTTEPARGSVLEVSMTLARPTGAELVARDRFEW